MYVVVTVIGGKVKRLVAGSKTQCERIANELRAAGKKARVKPLRVAGKRLGKA
jgi:hypothetical protein